MERGRQSGLARTDRKECQAIDHRQGDAPGYLTVLWPRPEESLISWRSSFEFRTRVNSVLASSWNMCVVFVYFRSTISPHLSASQRHKRLNEAISARPASAVEELDDLKTKSRSVLIMIGVEVWLVAYRLYGYRMKSCYLWKIACKVTVQKRVQSNIVHTNRGSIIVSNVAAPQRTGWGSPGTLPTSSRYVVICFVEP